MKAKDIPERWGYCSRHNKELGLSCPQCNREAGIQEAVELTLKAIEDEPAFPGDMPDELWVELDGNRHKTTLVMRNSVRLTKKGITDRLEAQRKLWLEE